MAATAKSATQFAIWLSMYEPKVFAALAAKAKAAKTAPKLSGLGQSSILATPISLTSVAPISMSSSSLPSIGSGSGFWSDITGALSSFGSGVSSAVSDVSSYLTSGGGFNHLASLATNFLNDKTAQTMQTQALRAQSGMAPANVGYAYNAAGQAVPVATNPYTGQVATNPYGQPYALNSAQLSSLQPSALSTYLPYIAGAGGLIAIIFFLNR